MNHLEYIMWVIVLTTLATFGTRVFPFIAFYRHKEHPMMDYVAKYTPPMVMLILVVYVLKDVNFVSQEGGYTLIAIAMTVAIHWWRSNPLFSIFSGTFLYMLLLQTQALS